LRIFLALWATEGKLRIPMSGNVWFE
jgi:hypothetical protein